MVNRGYFSILTFFFAISLSGYSQTMIDYKAGYMEGFKKDGADIQRLVGNVVFIDNSTTMYCDSAYLYENKDFDAFSNIKIIPKEGRTILTGKIMHYTRSTRMAVISGNVVLVDDSTTLTTNSILYNLRTGIANYPTQGTVIDGDDHIVSDLGSYDKTTKFAYFKKNVVITNPQGIVLTDTMNYNTSLKIAYFVGPTNMIGSDNDSIYCEKGWYNTNTGIALLRQNTWLKSKQQIINSDTLYYEKLTGIGKAYSNTVIVDTTQNILICGDYALYNRIKQTAVVTKKAMMIQVDNEDSLFLHADTIRSGLFVVHPDSLIAGTTAPDTYKTAPDTYKTKPDTYKTAPDTFKTASDTFKTAPDTFQTVADTFQTASDTFQTASDTFKFVKAYYHVKFFRSDLQGKCDSMFYSFKDSVLQLYRKPVLWTGKTQLTAEQINLLTHNQKIDKMLLNKSAFVISQEDSVRFQQIKGRNMIGYFDQHNKLYKMDVKGNGQTIYFAYQDNKEDSTQELIGVKKTESSAITIFLKDSKPTIITFINTVSGTFYPPLELSGQDLYLKNFMWYDKLRPNTPDDIFEWKN